MELDAYDRIMLRNAYEKLAAAQEIMQFISAYYRAKYNLSEGDEITPFGIILIQQPNMIGRLENSNATPKRQEQESNSREHQN